MGLAVGDSQKDWFGVIWVAKHGPQKNLHVGVEAPSPSHRQTRAHHLLQQRSPRLRCLGLSGTEPGLQSPRFVKRPPLPPKVS